MTSNRQKGAEFAERVRAHLESQGLGVKPEYEVQVGVNGYVKKTRKFDWGNESLLVECKAYDWTAGGNSPSAKLTTVNEAMLYFLAAPKSFRKMLFISETGKRPVRRPETLAEHYVRIYAHLIPEDDDLSATQLWPASSGSCASFGPTGARWRSKSPTTIEEGPNDDRRIDPPGGASVRDPG